MADGGEPQQTQGATADPGSHGRPRELLRHNVKITGGPHCPHPYTGIQDAPDMPMVDGSKTLCGTTSGLGMIHLHGTQTDCAPANILQSEKNAPNPEQLAQCHLA